MKDLIFGNIGIPISGVIISKESEEFNVRTQFTVVAETCMTVKGKDEVSFKILSAINLKNAAYIETFIGEKGIFIVSDSGAGLYVNMAQIKALYEQKVKGLMRIHKIYTVDETPQPIKAQNGESTHIETLEEFSFYVAQKTLIALLEKVNG